MNFVVLLNAWNLNSHELGFSGRDAAKPGTWHLVNSLLEKYILEKIRSMQPLVSSPGSDLPVLVQLVTEPLAWHGLVIQSCVRSTVPSGKKKKKGGSADCQPSNEIQDSIRSLCGILEDVTKWLSEQINKPVEENLEIILSSLQGEKQGEGPGKVFQVLETKISSMNGLDVGDRIAQALQCWNSADVARKVITGQGMVLTEFLRICKSKIKLMQALKPHV
ncbi:unnamed protein product [Ilex paraguariensis]